MTDRLHLPPKHRRALEALLRAHLPDVEVWAYGSRVNGRSHDGSDLDLVLRGPDLKEIPAGQLGDFEEAVRESNIPFLVEARDWARLPERFHHEIERDHAVLTERDTFTLAADGWRSVRLGDVCKKIGSGATPRGGKEVYLKDGPCSLIRSQNVYNNHFRHDGLVFITAQHATELDNVEVFPDDVLLNITGDSVARACRVPSDVLPARVNQHVAIIRPDPKALSAHFLQYFLVTPGIQTVLMSWAGSGGTRNALTKGMLESLDVYAPEDVAEQHAIAYVLGTLDDKIELNRRMNETLEAMVRALFKTWFVDFDPVRAKMEGRDPGLPRHIADLFPGRLVDSEVGEIPTGWQLGTLHDIAFLNSESWSAKHSPENVVYVALANIKWGYIESVQTFPWDEAPSRARRVLRKGDTVVGTVRPGNGSFALIDEDGLTGSTGFAVLRPREELDREFIWCVATNSKNIDRLSHLADGGAYPAVQADAVAETTVALAAPPTREAFSRLVQPMLDKIETNKRESHILAALRNTLLPELVFGRMRVGEAQNLIKIVA